MGSWVNAKNPRVIFFVGRVMFIAVSTFDSKVVSISLWISSIVSV